MVRKGRLALTPADKDRLLEFVRKARQEYGLSLNEALEKAIKHLSPFNQTKGYKLESATSVYHAHIKAKRKSPKNSGSQDMEPRVVRSREAAISEYALIDRMITTSPLSTEERRKLAFKLLADDQDATTP